MTEKQLENHLINYIRVKGGYVQKIQSGSLIIGAAGRQRRVKMADEGTPDLIVTYKGKAFFLELKKDEKAYKGWLAKCRNFDKTKKLTPYNKQAVTQRAQHKEIESAGGNVYLAWDIDLFVKFIKKLDYEDRRV